MSPMTAQELKAECFIDLLSPRTAVLSPTGDRVIYSAAPFGRKGEHVLSSLWVAETQKVHSSYQLTSGLYNDHCPQWHPDGTAVAFVSDRHKAGESCAIYLQQMKAGEPVALTDVECKKSITAFAWSPSGDYIAYLSGDEKSADVQAKEKSGDDATVYGEHWDYARLRLLHVASRKVSVLVERPKHVAALAWSPDSKHILYTLHPDTVYDSPVDLRHGNGVGIETVAVADGKSEHVLDFPGLISSGVHNRTTFVWGDDGVKFVAPVRPHSCCSSWVVYRLDLPGKKYERIAYGDQNDAREVKGGKDWTVSAVFEGLEDQVRIVGGETLYAEPEELQTWDVVKKSDGEFIVVVATSSVAKPLELYTVDTKTKKKHIQLTHHGEAVAAAQLGTAHLLDCKSDDGQFNIQGLYLTPGASSEKPSKPLPTAVFVHGGPYFRQTDAFHIPHFPWSPFVLAAGKYGILVANYRGNYSQGDAHAKAVSGTSGTLEHDDILTLVDKAIKQGFVDPENIVIGGWSYGGVMSYLAAVRNGQTYAGEAKTWRYKGVIPGAGVCDQEMMSMTSDFVHYSSENAGSNAWTTDWRTETHGRQGSAVWWMKQGAERVPPCLIIHGEKDDRVPVFQAWAFQRALRHYDIEHELVTYPREGHMFEERAHLVDMLKRVRQFCDERIGS